MTESVLVFRNQMSPRNWAYIVLAFALAVPFLVMDGADIVFALMLSVALAVAACLFALGLIAWMGRRNIGVLRLGDGVLEAEMLSPFGKGRQLRIPLDEIEDWRLTRRWPTLRFRYERADFNLPVQGAYIDWPAIHRIAAGIREIPR